MAINKAKVQEYLRQQLKLVGVQDSVADTYLDTSMQLGGGLFATNDWPFLMKKKTVTLTSSMSEYRLTSNDYIGPELGAVVSIRRLTSADNGIRIPILAAHYFDNLYPYPDSLTTNYPVNAKIEKEGDDVYLFLAPPPNSSYTLELTYKRAWNQNLLADAPDELLPVYMQACRCYTLPSERAVIEFQIYDRVASNALIRISPEKEVRSTKDSPPMIHGCNETLKAMGYYDVYGWENF